MPIGPIGPEHADALDGFRCANAGQPWTSEVEDGIREYLADAVQIGDVAACAIWDGDRVCAVIAWRQLEDGLWRVATLAVAHGHRRRGYAKQLKRHVVELARAAGARYLISSVHQENIAMQRINDEFHAGWEPDPESPDYFIVVIDLTA